MNAIRRPMARLRGRASTRSSIPSSTGTTGYPWQDGELLYAEDLNEAFLSLINATTGVFLPLTGGSLTGFLTLNADPVQALQAATKEYVDGAVTRAGGPFLPLVGGSVTGTVSAQAFNAPVFSAMPPTGHFFVQDGAHISRISDRLFVGPATANDGRYPNTSMDWLQAFLASSVGGSEVGPMVGTTMSVLSINGEFGFVSGSRTSDNPTADSGNTIGIAGYAINDNTAVYNTAWAFYGEARRLSGINSSLTIGMEIGVSNQGGVVAPTPYTQLPGGTYGHQIASGCGTTLPGAANTTCAIDIRANPTSFGAGIVFGATAIAGTDGNTGFGDALHFAKGHTLTWYSSDGNQTSKIQGNISDHTLSTYLEFNNTGMTVQGPTGGDLLIVSPVANSVNYVVLAGAPTGGQVGILAGGSDANIDLKLVAQGAGYIDLTTPTATTATAGGVGALPATVAGYLTIKVAGVLHKLPFYAV